MTRLFCLLLASLLPFTTSQSNAGICDIGPDAMTTALRGILTEDESVPQTCLEHQGKTRCYYTYTPPCAVGQQVPLMVSMHGRGSCPVFSTYYTGWAQVSQQQCFVLLWPVGNDDANESDSMCFNVPGGLSLPNSTESAPSCCCSKAGMVMAPTTDDVLVRTMVLDVHQSMAATNITTIDPTRIYMTGHSNGCIASLALAARHSDIVAAVACHAGQFFTSFGENYSPVPVWMAHGTLDDVIPYEGSPPLFFSIHDAVNVLGDANGCSSEGSVTNLPSGDELYRRAENCEAAPVELVTLYDVGHAPFLNAPDASFAALFDTTSMAWEFCSAFSKPQVPEAFLVTSDEEEENGDEEEVIPEEDDTSEENGEGDETIIEDDADEEVTTEGEEADDEEDQPIDTAGASSTTSSSDRVFRAHQLALQVLALV